MKYIYYCDNCNKVYKVAGEGRKVKYTNCRQGLRDLSISEEDYLVLDRSARERLKHKSEEEKKKSCEYPLENELNSYATSVPQEAAKENETQTFLCRCLRAGCQEGCHTKISATAPFLDIG